MCYLYLVKNVALAIAVTTNVKHAAISMVLYMQICLLECKLIYRVGPPNI